MKTLRKRYPPSREARVRAAATELLDDRTLVHVPAFAHGRLELQVGLMKLDLQADEGARRSTSEQVREHLVLRTLHVHFAV